MRGIKIEIFKVSLDKDMGKDKSPNQKLCMKQNSSLYL